MKIVNSQYIFINGEIKENLAVAFDSKILDIAPLETLKEKFQYRNFELIESKNTLLMAGLINSHVHLEFSNNSTELNYGNFIDWLDSVIDKRTTLINSCNSDCLNNALNLMLKNGITTIGVISSYGNEMEVLKESPIKKIIFNELIGSQPHQAIWENFEFRVDKSISLRDEKLYPAIAIHSPYSVNPTFIKKAINLAKNKNLRVSAHFMESQAEREWLDDEVGDFKRFFSQRFKIDKPINTSDNFLSLFPKYTLFTHCNYINQKELLKFQENNFFISHCPISNKLLGNRNLQLSEIEKFAIPWNISTDGLSSNTSLNLWDDLKTALFIHSGKNLKNFAFQLLKSVTETPAKQLNLNSGKIEIGKNSDLILIDLKDKFSDKNYIPLHLILKNYPIQRVFINGT